jgi:hypothetical protein
MKTRSSFTKANLCRIKKWRNESAAEAISAIKAFRLGKLESASANKVIIRLHEMAK